MLPARVGDLSRGRNKTTGAASGARSTVGSGDLQLHKTQPDEEDDHVSVAFVQACVFGSYTFCIGSTETNLQS